MLSETRLSDVCCTLTISHITKSLTEADVLNEINRAAGHSSFVLYFPDEKQSRNSSRAFVCFNNELDTVTCLKALNRKRLGGASGKRCEVQLGLVHRKQALYGADSRDAKSCRKTRRGTVRRSPSQSKRSLVESVQSPPATLIKRSTGSWDSLDLQTEVCDDDDNEVDPDILSRFESRFGYAR